MKRFPVPELLIAGLAGLAAVTGPVAAAELLTPETAVTLALAHHPLVRAADSDVAAAMADQKIARSGWIPRVELTEDWTRSTNPVFVFGSKLGQERFTAADFALDALNQPEAFTNAATRVTLRQNIWDAGRTRLYGKATADGVTASSSALERTRDEVAFGAIRAFWDATLAGEILKVTRAGEDAAKANADLAARHVEAGLTVPSDRMSADVRLAEVQAMRIRAEQGVAVARAALRQALGLGEDREFELDPPRIEPSRAASDPEAVVTEALAARPDLMSLDARLRQAETGTRIAKSRYVPEVGLGAAYEWNGSHPFSAGGSNWSAGISVRVPVFEGTETGARVARATADLDRGRAYRDAMAEGVRLEVRSVWADRVSANERLAVAESAITHADEALRIVRDRYEEGMAVMVELLGAEAASTAAKGNRAAAVRDLAVATAALDLAAGRSLSPQPPAEER